jgi:hypothetical protein
VVAAAAAAAVVVDGAVVHGSTGERRDNFVVFLAHCARHFWNLYPRTVQKLKREPHLVCWTAVGRKKVLKDTIPEVCPP